PEEDVEALTRRKVRREMAEVPLADERRRVASLAQHLGDGLLGGIEPGRVEGEEHAERAELHPGRIAPREQRRARRCADRRTDVELREPRPLARHAIQVRRRDVGTSVAAEVAVAHVVREYEDEVRAARPRGATPAALRRGADRGPEARGGVRGGGRIEPAAHDEPVAGAGLHDDPNAVLPKRPPRARAGREGASSRLRTTSPSPLRISTMTPSRCSKRAPPELTRSGRLRPPPTTAQEILHEPLARTSSTSTPPGLPLVRSLKRTPRLPLVRRTLQHGLPLQVPPAGTVAAERGGA